MTKIFTKNNFDSEVLKEKLPVLVDFYADWCVPCKMMAPVLDQLAEELEGKMVIGKLDVVAEPELGEKYRVVSIPMMVIFKDGEQVETIMGATPKNEMLAKINEYI